MRTEGLSGGSVIPTMSVGSGRAGGALRAWRGRRLLPKNLNDIHQAFIVPLLQSECSYGRCYGWQRVPLWTAYKLPAAH